MFKNKIFLVFVVIFVSWTLIPVLVVNIFNNLTTSAIINVWEGIRPEEGLPRCRKIVDSIKAEKFIEIALDINPKSIETLTNQGRIAWLKGECSVAEETWLKTIKHEDSYERNALWYFWFNHEYIIDLIGREKLANYFTGLGIISNEKGNPDSAISWYEISMNLYPTKSVVIYLTNLYRQKDQNESAKLMITNVIDLFSSDPETYWWLKGQLSEIEHDWESSSIYYLKGTLAATDPFDFYLLLAKSLERLGNWEEAESAYRKAVLTRPDDILGYIGLGNIQRHYGNFTNALKFYKEAEALALGNYFPKFIIGELFYEYRLIDHAEDYFHQALSLNPDHDVSNYYLARIYYDFGYIDKAISALQKGIIESSYLQIEWLVLLGDWQWENGDLRVALSSYSAARRINPEDIRIKSRIKILVDEINLNRYPR